MIGNIKLVLIWVLLSISMAVCAEPMTYKDTLVKLNELLAKKDYEQAYQVADEQTFEHGGLPEFDLLAGFAAFGSEYYQEAVFAFERVVLEQPDSFLARFYLAQTYQKMNNLAAAINELDYLLSKPMAEEQQERVARLKSRFESLAESKTKKWGHSFSAGIVYDTNVNSGTTEELAYFRNPTQQEQVLPVLLTDSSQESHDWGYNFSYSAYYQHQLNQHQKIKVDAAIAHYGFVDLNQYRRNPINFSVSFEQALDQGKLNTSIYTRPLLLESQDYRTENGISMLWQQGIDKQSSFLLSGAFSRVTKDQVNDQDFNRTKLAGTYLYLTKVIHGLTLHWYQDVSDNALYQYNDKDVTGVMYQLTWPINNAMLLSSFAMVENHKYKAHHPWATTEDNQLVTRDETLTTLTSQLTYKASEDTSLKLHVTLQDKSSNLALFSFNRAEFGASWHYKL